MARPIRRPYKGPWPRVRRAVLERDNYQCQIMGPGCKGVAEAVDHIVPITVGGEWYDLDNLRAACATCNRSRVDSKQSGAWRNAPARINLVIGPPGADLLGYCRTHANAADLVVDYSSLLHALGSDDAARKARNATIDRVRRGQAYVPVVWITSHNPKAETIYPYHHLVEVGVPREDASDGVQPVGDVARWLIIRRGQTAGPTNNSRAW